MDLTKKTECFGCTKLMNQGSTEIGPRGTSQYRFCLDCDIGMLVFSKQKGYKYSLVIKKEDEDGN